MAADQLTPRDRLLQAAISASAAYDPTPIVRFVADWLGCSMLFDEEAAYHRWCEQMGVDDATVDRWIDEQERPDYCATVVYAERR